MYRENKNETISIASHENFMTTDEVLWLFMSFYDQKNFYDFLWLFVTFLKLDTMVR